MTDDLPSVFSDGAPGEILGFQYSDGDTAIHPNPFAPRNAPASPRPSPSWTRPNVNRTEVETLQAALRSAALGGRSRDTNLQEASTSPNIRLKLPTDTVELVKQGFAIAYREFAGHDDDISEIDSLTYDEVCEFVEIKLRRCFAGMADNFALQNDPVVKIGGEGGFIMRVAVEVLKHIEITEAHRTDFVNDLYWSLVGFLRSGGALNGDWGAIVVSEKNLYMRVEPDDGRKFVDGNEIDVDVVNIPYIS